MIGRVSYFIFEERGYTVGFFRRPNISFKEVGSVEGFHRMFFDKMREAYENAQSRGVDFFIYDRGFFDRIGMLHKDLARGSLGEKIREEILPSIEEYSERTDFPLMFLLSPETSLSRWDAQRASGLDNSKLCEGLEPPEDIHTLREVSGIYRTLQIQYPRIQPIYAEAPLGNVTRQVFTQLNGSVRESHLNQERYALA